MAKKRSLLKHVTEFQDRHGKLRHRFRRVGYESGYFHNPIGSEEYLAEYHAFMSGEIVKAAGKRKVRPRSIDDLLPRYYTSNDYLGNAQPNTLDKRRATLEAFRDGTNKKGFRRGDMLVKDANFSGLDKIIAKAAQKNDKGIGGPYAAQFLKKQLTRMFSYAVKIGWIDKNPMEFVSYTAPKSEGYHTWTEEEIDQYRNRHPLGTNARLALEILLWTGKRRSDGRLIGKQNHRDGMIWGRDKKTGKEWWLPIAPQLAEAIAAMPPHDHLCYLVSSKGQPYSAASIGNMMRSWCDQAGLPQCTAHGLRKAISRRMAELDINNAGGKSVTLHRKDDEYAIYTAAANQKKLATSAISKVSDWEKSNRNEVRQNENQKRA